MRKLIFVFAFLLFYSSCSKDDIKPVGYLYLETETPLTGITFSSADKKNQNILKSFDYPNRKCLIELKAGAYFMHINCQGISDETGVTIPANDTLKLSYEYHIWKEID